MSSLSGRGKRGYSTDSSRGRLVDSYFAYGNKDKYADDDYLPSRQKDIYLNDDYARDGGKHGGGHKGGGYGGGHGGGYHEVEYGGGYELDKKLHIYSILAFAAFALAVGYLIYFCFLIPGNNCLTKKKRKKRGTEEGDLGEVARKMQFIYGLIDGAESLWGSLSDT